ncbi:hypothetical protein ADUPG1_012951 [Aduncisulcus paluster]|nr:hypothetical protein ADUPG1_012951 [Aduncisulcus paluster]
MFTCNEGNNFIEAGMVEKKEKIFKIQLEDDSEDETIGTGLETSGGSKRKKTTPKNHFRDIILELTDDLDESEKNIVAKQILNAVKRTILEIAGSGKKGKSVVKTMKDDCFYLLVAIDALSSGLEAVELAYHDSSAISLHLDERGRKIVHKLKLRVTRFKTGQKE